MNPKRRSLRRARRFRAVRKKPKYAPKPKPVAKVRRGSLKLMDLLGCFQARLAAEQKPTNTPLKNIPIYKQAGWIVQAFKESNKKGFDLNCIAKVILPAVKLRPGEFAKQFGYDAKLFFAGLGENTEFFFKEVGRAGKLKKFVSRTHVKGSFAFCDCKALARGLGQNVDLFFEGLDRIGFFRFGRELKKDNGRKRKAFLLGLSEALGKDSEKFLQVKRRLEGKPA